jgi:hypothetical protein
MTNEVDGMSTMNLQLLHCDGAVSYLLHCHPGVRAGRELATGV